ncbi:MAG: sulfatase-like hydrolase/transferase, partial [Rubripirellula sp.]
RWIRSHSDDFGIAPNRIASAGGSAGGHLAAFVGTVDDQDAPQNRGDEEVSAKSNAMLLFNPVYDNGPDGWGSGRVGDRFPEFSPAHNLSADDPPSIVFLGSDDKLIPVSTAESFRDQCEKLGIESELHVYEGQPHGFFNHGRDNNRWYLATVTASDRFLERLGWITGPPTVQETGKAATSSEQKAEQRTPNRSDASPNDDTSNHGSPPNFIIVFCDDMGYADIGPFGAEGYSTPHLDRIAREGMKFTDFYVGRSFCTPSRAALLTGCIPTRVGIGGNFGPKSTTGLNPNEITIAEALRPKGYATACFGKWHLGHMTKFLPTHQGFDEFFGLPYSNDMWPFHPNVRDLPMEERIKRWPHLPLYEDDKIVNSQVTPEDQIELTTQLFDRASKFIDEHHDQPFFLYLPSPQPHVPLFVSDKFSGKTPRGIFGDVISEIDWGVGQLLDALARNDIDNNTCLIFTSDNGPWLAYGDHAGSAKPLREGKGTNFEGGFRVPCLMRWPTKIPAGSECSEVAGTIDLLPTMSNLAGAPASDRKIDGKDISELMFALPNATSPHDVFFHYDGGNRLVALRSGKWKLMFPQNYNSPIGGRDGIPGKNARKQIELSLFDLENDISEATNLADQHPDVVQRLKGLADAMRKDLGDGKDAAPGRRPIGR